MKKRVPAKPKLAADRPTAKRGAGKPRVLRGAKNTAVDNDYGYPDTHMVVTEEQFQFLLDLLDKPPDVPEELRREVANRRWK